MSLTTRIHIVEDEHIVAKDLSRRLTNMGYDVTGITDSFEDTLSNIATNKPDLVLMDIHLKGERDGIETTEELQKRFDIPVIYLTAYADKNTVERAKNTQPLAYLLKPFDEDELLTTIEMALHKFNMQKQLVESEKLLATTLKSIGDAVITTDSDLKIQYLNPVAESITGWALSDAIYKDLNAVFKIFEEIPGHRITNIISDLATHHDFVNHVENVVLLNKSKTSIPIDLTLTSILDDHQNTYGYVLVFRDITERKKHEERIREGLLIEQALTDVSRQFATRHKPDLKYVISRLGAAVNVSRSYIFELSDDESHMSNTFEWCNNSISPEIENLQNIPVNLVTWWFDTLAKDEIIIIEDTSIMPREAANEQKMLRDQNIKAAIVVPFINMQGRLLGFMGFDDTIRVRKWSKKEIQVLRLVCEMISNYFARNAAEQALIESEDRFRNLIQSSYDIISIINQRGILSYQSPSVKNVLNYTSDELKGTGLLRYVHPEDKRHVVSKFLNFVNKKDKTLSIEFRFKIKDGGWAILESYGTFLSPADPNSDIVLNSRDISDRKRAENDLRNAKEKAEEMNRLKTTFLANMSHEIRTPLTGIMGFASILESELEEEEQQQMAHRIHFSGKRLLETIDAILDLSKIEANKINISLEPVILRDEINTAIQLLQPLAKSKNISISSEIDDHETSALLDKQLLAQILNNLIGNAIKYTDKGGITIRTGLLNSFETPKVYIEVEDTGRGISNEFIPLIFDEFRQESQGLSRKYEGSGLGLTITKKLTELMDGEITVQSEKNEGSVFTMVFPALEYSAEHSSEGIDDSLTSANASDLPKKKVLLIDDNDDSRDVTSRFLKKHYHITEAVSGERALDIIKNDMFDAVLLDINLGHGIDGVDVLHEIRRMNNKTLPIIALTAYAMKGDKDYFIKKGFNGYISKPFRKKDVLQELQLQFKNGSRNN